MNERGMVTCPKCKGIGYEKDLEIEAREYASWDFYENLGGYDLDITKCQSEERFKYNDCKECPYYGECLGEQEMNYVEEHWKGYEGVTERETPVCDLCKGTGEVDWITSIMFNEKET